MPCSWLQRPLLVHSVGSSGWLEPARLWRGGFPGQEGQGDDGCQRRPLSSLRGSGGGGGGGSSISWRTGWELRALILPWAGTQAGSRGECLRNSPPHITPPPTPLTSWKQPWRRCQPGGGGALQGAGRLLVGRGAPRASQPAAATLQVRPVSPRGRDFRLLFSFSRRQRQESESRRRRRRRPRSPAAASPRAPRPPARPRPMEALLLALLLALLPLPGRASDVLELTDDDFDSGLADRPVALVEFYAPWCGHCKRLAPEYESAATRLKGIVPLVKVDCTANSNTCNKYGVSGYPTLKIFRNGEESGSYDGPRTADGIVSHLKKQAGPASVAIRAEDFERFISEKDAAVVGFFKELFGEAHSEFMKAASNLRDHYRFGHTSDEGLIKQYESDGEGIFLFRPPHLANKFEENSVRYTESKITTGKIKKFLQDNLFGICPHMTEDNKELIQGKDLLVAYYDVDYEKNPKGSNYWRNRVMKVASTFLDAGHKLNFAVASRKTFGHELSEFGLDSSSTSDVPVVAIRTAKGEKYVMQEEFSRDGKALERFLQDYFDGNLKKYLKSEPIPESNDGPVKVVVAENFDDIVNAEGKDVLIEFYAPWCGHCKNLEPKYKELGEKLGKDPNILVAKMDATANDVPSPYEVRGFPTIYFSPAGSKESPKKYEGGREVSDFISYLKREATYPPILQEDEKPKKKKKPAPKEDL
ncbi:protein disulfide-isomerase A3 [Hemicordylus capensis]|uniref:protein disulfide-isomerase A3 n=1 Tax=Hemicordylus capensis TaxID=884348 RepID=UPI002302CDA1|nr:protein disulfide-isomerase A3 [Hemicordylus capensis]